MDRDIWRVDAFDTADSDGLCFVLIFISRLPERLSGAISQAANHGWSAGRFNVYHAGQIFQTGQHTKFLQYMSNTLIAI